MPRLEVFKWELILETPVGYLGVFVGIGVPATGQLKEGLTRHASGYPVRWARHPAARHL